MWSPTCHSDQLYVGISRSHMIHVLYGCHLLLDLHVLSWAWQDKRNTSSKNYIVSHNASPSSTTVQSNYTTKYPSCPWYGTNKVNAKKITKNTSSSFVFIKCNHCLYYYRNCPVFSPTYLTHTIISSGVQSIFNNNSCCVSQHTFRLRNTSETVVNYYWYNIYGVVQCIRHFIQCWLCWQCDIVIFNPNHITQIVLLNLSHHIFLVLFLTDTLGMVWEIYSKIYGTDWKYLIQTSKRWWRLELWSIRFLTFAIYCW